MAFEDIDKKMERWHNRIWPTITMLMLALIMILIITSLILMSYYLGDLATVWNASEEAPILTFNAFLILFWISIILSPAYLIYTRIFTKFNFPSIDYGGGRKPKKTIKPYGI